MRLRTVGLTAATALLIGGVCILNAKDKIGAKQHWEIKKLRGRTNQLPARTGSVPTSYERIFDAEGYTLLRTRVEKVARPELRACLRDLFFEPVSA